MSEASTRENPPPHAGPLDQRNDWLRAAAHADVYLSKIALKAHAATKRTLVLAGLSLFDIEPGTERSTRALHNHDAGLVVLHQASEVVPQFCHHGGIDGIERFRPVQCDPVHLAFFLDHDGFKVC